jgi:hypothetical protein
MAQKKPGTYKIPFSYDPKSKYWSMMDYTSAKDGEVAPAGTARWGAPDQWRENCVFDAMLTLTGNHRGRSAARFSVRSEYRKERYSMAMDAFYQAVVEFGVEPGGIIKGTWTFRKQGSNYGLYPVLP